jgi:uncharacterized membrane protein
MAVIYLKLSILPLAAAAEQAGDGIMIKNDSRRAALPHRPAGDVRPPRIGPGRSQARRQGLDRRRGHRHPAALRGQRRARRRGRLGLRAVLSHRLAVPSHAMLAAAIEMLAGGVVLLAVGAGSGEFSRIQWSSIPATSWIALAYLIGPGSILAFTAYGYALSHLPVTTVSTYAYVNPIVAVQAGIVFLGERFSWREGLGAALVLASVVLTLRRSRGTSGPAPARDGEMPEAEMLPANAAALSRR